MGGEIQIEGDVFGADAEVRTIPIHDMHADDVLVVRVAGFKLTQAEADDFKGRVRAIVPGVRVMVIDETIDLAVVTAARADELLEAAGGRADLDMTQIAEPRVPF